MRERRRGEGDGGVGGSNWQGRVGVWGTFCDFPHAHKHFWLLSRLRPLSCYHLALCPQVCTTATPTAAWRR